MAGGNMKVRVCVCVLVLLLLLADRDERLSMRACKRDLFKQGRTCRPVN